MVDDADFIREAYAYLLNHEPDQTAQFYLDQLNHGFVSRIEVLHAITNTAEAKKRGMRIRGLKLRYILIAPFRIRFIGYGLRILSGLLRFPRHVRAIYTINRELTKVVARSELITADLARSQLHIKEMAERLDKRSAGLEHRFTSLMSNFMSKIGRIGVTIDRRDEAATALHLVVDGIQLALDQNVQAVTTLRDCLSALDQNVQTVRTTLQDHLSALDQNVKDVTAIRDRLSALDQNVKDATTLRDHLSVLDQNLQTVTTTLQDHLSVLDQNLQTVATHQDRLSGIDERFGEVERLSSTITRNSQALATLQDRLEKFDALLLAGPGSLVSRIDRIEAERSAFDIDLAITEFRRRLLALERSADSRTGGEIKSIVEQPRAKKQASRTASFPQGNSTFDTFYADFESRFRGTRADIQNRQSIYLSYLKTNDENLGKKPVFDIGCGRGEWLQLLGNHGIKAIGVDINERFFRDDQRHGLTVVHGDGIEFLRSQPDQTARAVTGFHIIEHLEFSVLLELLDQTLRVLAPGGLAIFETPNPENLITAAHTFYLDPTHRHPIPPQLAAYLLEHRGFSDVEILRLHEDQQPELGDLESSLLRNLLWGPRDYGVLGRK